MSNTDQNWLGRREKEESSIDTGVNSVKQLEGLKLKTTKEQTDRMATNKCAATAGCGKRGEEHRGRGQEVRWKGCDFCNR